MRPARIRRCAGALAGIAAVGLALAAPAAAPGAPTDVADVYSSLPFHGPGRVNSQGVLNGEQLALEQAGRVAGTHPVKLVSLDDSTAAARGWDPAKTVTNASKAAQDPNGAAYIGEFNSSASSLSIPILNEAGVLQVSPTNTYPGLTVHAPGTRPAEPGLYYPQRIRTFGRIVPNDTVQAAALVGIARQDHCPSLQPIADGELYGNGLAGDAIAAARRLHFRMAPRLSWDPAARSYRTLAKRVRAKCVLVAGIAQKHAYGLVDDLVAVHPRIRVFAGDGLDPADFSGGRRLSRRASARLTITEFELAPAAYPPAAQAFFSAYRTRFGAAAGRYAIYGYEAMNLVLSAIAGPKALPVDNLFAIRNRQSVLGSYSIDRHGDTTLRTYGVYRIRSGKLEFVRAITAP